MARYPFFLKIVRHVFILFLLFAVLPLWGQFKYDPKTPSSLFIPYREGNLWGYCDTLGQVLLTPQYDSLGFFEGLGPMVAIFTKNGRYGVLNDQFTEIMRAEYACTNLWWDKYNRLVVLKSGGKTGVVSIEYGMNTYEVVPMEFDSISFEFMTQGGYIMAVQAGKWGLFREGELLAASEFDELFSPRYFRETAEMNGKIGRKKDRYFRISPSGKQTELTDTTRMIGRRRGSQQEYDAQHADKIPPKQQERLITLTEPLRSTKAISKILFNRAVGFREGRYEYVLAEKNKKVALLDVGNGKIYSGFYDDIVEFIDVGYVTLSEDGSGPSQPFSSLLLVRKGKKYGIVSLKDKEIYPFIFDGFGEITWRSIVTRQNKKEGLINLYTSYPVIPCKYDKISYHKLLRVTGNQLFTIYKVSLNGRTGYVGENGVEYFKNQ